MMSARQAGALTVASLFMATAAQAAPPGFYVGASVGQTGHDIGPSRGILVSFGGPFGGGIASARPDVVDVDDGEIGWSGTLGYRINEHFAAEFAYFDFGSADVLERYEVPGVFFPTPIIINRDMRVSVRGPALSMLVSVPAGPIDIFLRGGVLFADEEVELRGLVGSDNSNTFGSEVPLAGIGIDWSFKERWAARLEYQITGDIEDNIEVGENEIEHVSVSVLYRL